ncbi:MULTISPECIES: transporter [unclassified Pseudodesulfovibrio]|uniref:transporter n=1 Tax=unclassified Pseudodesulfovibrio TaxID=2661612 RepID=UPI0013E3C492|nr:MULTISPECIES: transporter [unclassified Pseudodesulfovibrio]MCJ2164882.1 transporter [Pseudodesulfovibrio sp. S3-i]
MKRLTVFLSVCAWLMLVGGPHQVHAGSNAEADPESEQKVAAKPAGKPVKCIAPVNMSNGMVLPKGKYAANVKYRYVHKDSLYNGSTKKNGSYGGKYDRVNQSVQLTLKAGLFENFEARVMVPFWDKQVKRKPGNLAKPWDTDTVSGLGDVVVMGRYALMTQRGGDWMNLALGAGLKLPTGDADHENGLPYSNTHKYIGPSGQLGSGSWDPKFEIGATKIIGRSRFDAHMMYTVTGQGAHDSRVGNQFKYDFGYGYALNKYFDLELELNGVDQQRQWFDGSADDSNGGHTIFITPGVHWKMTESSHLSVGVPLVVYRDLNGYSATPERNSRYGIGEDFQVVTRIGISF